VDEARQLPQQLGFSQFFNIKETLDEAVSFFAARGEGEKGTVFPRIFKCPICSRRLKAPKAGRFRCSECKTILALAETGAVALG
jgi:anti-sigma B factor antagonist